MKGPLAGIRICDMTRVLAGPYCTMVLGDMGAEVIKIEKPGTGDDTRKWGPPFTNKQSYYFLSINRNKKSLAVDITTDAGRQIIHKICKESDVLIENFLPGKLESMSLGYKAIAKTNPQIVYCSITGFGSKGPEKLLPGYDLIASAIGGGMAVTGYENKRPARHGVATTDILTGMYAHSAILASLYQRTITGKGMKIDCSLLQSQIASMHSHASSFLNAGERASRLGTQHANISPFQAFEADDGIFVIAAGNDKHFRNLCKALEMEELIQDERFITNAERVVNRKLLTQLIQDRVKDHSISHWIEHLENYGVPCGKVNDIEEACQVPSVQKHIRQLTHPDYGNLHVFGPAVEFEDELFENDSAPPVLGEHSREILASVLKMDESHIQRLIDQKVIECPA